MANRQIFAAPKHCFYVYTLTDLRLARTPRIFYIGKGCGPRINQHEREAENGCDCYKCRTIRAIWKAGKKVKKTIVFTDRDEQAAFDYEERLISQIGLANLTNAVPGGGIRREWGVQTSKSRYEMNDAEFLEYLRRAAVPSNDIADAVDCWRMERIGFLSRKLTEARRYGASEEATILQAQIDVIQNDRKSGKQLSLF